MEQARLYGNLNMHQILQRLIRIMSFGTYTPILIEAPILAIGGAILWRIAVRRFHSKQAPKNFAADPTKTTGSTPR